MHDCPPPADALDRWLTAYPSIKSKGRYGHLLLEQDCDCDADLIAEMRPYFESAHRDARTFFHDQMGIDLHPDADDPAAHATYPTCLPPITRRGLFGEVMAGMVSEHYELVGKHSWRIPVFLFRHHEDAEHYLFALARDGTRTRELFGRKGSDFIGIALAADGSVARAIVGEAKWRKDLQPSVMDDLMHGKLVKNKKTGIKARSGKGIWYQVNRDIPAPHGLRQLQRLLRELDPDGHSAAILSLDRLLSVRNATPLPRTNLILIAGGDVPGRDAQTSLIPWEKMPADYTAPHALQVVEMILNDGDTLIDGLYDALWPAP